MPYWVLVPSARIKPIEISLKDIDTHNLSTDRFYQAICEEAAYSIDDPRYLDWPATMEVYLSDADARHRRNKVFTAIVSLLYTFQAFKSLSQKEANNGKQNPR